MCESENAQAYWDVPVYAEHAFGRDNRVDARFVDHNAMRVLAVEMSCPWSGQSREEGFCEDVEVTTTTVGAYQTVPRLHDRTAERHYGGFDVFSLVVQGARYGEE